MTRQLKKHERLILAGRELNDMKLARERYAAMKAGREIPPSEEGIPLYAILDAAEVNPKTSIPYETAKALRAAGKDLAALIAHQKRKEKAAERQTVADIRGRRRALRPAAGTYADRPARVCVNI
jgi:hypothetical protein